VLRWFPDSKLLLNASHAALPILSSSKLPPVVDAAHLLVFQIIDKTIRNSKFCCLPETSPYYHNVFTFTVFLLEGRACVAWEPSNKIMLFLPPRKIKCLSLHLTISSLNLLFINTSHLSLSLGFGFKGLTTHEHLLWREFIAFFFRAGEWFKSVHYRFTQDSSLKWIQSYVPSALSASDCVHCIYGRFKFCRATVMQAIRGKGDIALTRSWPLH
jgi:hypothetical protein